MGDAPVARIVTCPQCGKRNRVKTAAAGYPHCQNCDASLPWVVDVDDAGFREVVLQASLPALVDFWAPWCGPCRVVSPIVERLAGTLAGKMKVAKLWNGEFRKRPAPLPPSRARENGCSRLTSG